MEILRKPQGIDLKAKNSALQGTTEIILKDADTGRIKEIVRQKNMFTNALDSLFNKSAFNFANDLTGLKWSGNAPAAQTPIVNKALGGILLFPNALGNNPDLLYPDFDSNYPTGYASRAEYTQDDPRQGAFNGNLSGHIANTNSYKFVYDWGAAFGNGQIAAVALSNIKCYKYFNDLTTAVEGYFFSKQMVRGWNRRAIGINSKGAYYNNGEHAGAGSLFFARFPERKIELEYDPMAAYSTYEEQIPDYTYGGGYGAFFCVDEDYIHVFTITSAAAASSTVQYDKIDVDDYTVTTTTFTVAAYLTAAANLNVQLAAVRNGFVYLPRNGWGSIYKIDLSNAANVTEIEMPSGTNLNYGTTIAGGIIYGYNFTIGQDDIVRKSVTTSGGNQWYRPCYLDGVWCGKILAHGGGGGGEVHSMFVDMITPYTATHADLETTVRKTSDKSMTVNYIVTQV